jgi:hypothetical protein
MRHPHYTLNREHVHAHASHLLQSKVGLRGHGRLCTADVLTSLLLAACAALHSLHALCQRLRDGPSDDTAYRALLATLPGFAELERRLNRALQADLPAALRRRRQPVAIDLHLVPYHGEPYEQPEEVYRGAAKSGTSHFHAYATCYVIRKGRRYTVGLTAVRAGDPFDDVVRRLLRQAAKAGVRPKLVLLDRGFFNVRVVRYLQAARQPFLMLMPCRGRQPDHPRGPGGTQRLCHQKRSGWHTHTWSDPQGVKATVAVCVRVTAKGRAAARRRPGRRGRAKPPGRPYAYWGWRPASYRSVSELYRSRFAIETTYRQLGQARLRTSSRDPAVRLLYVGVALVLRNVWVWAHYQFLSGRRRGGRVPHPERLRFKALLDWLLDVAKARFGARDSTPAEVPVPIPLPLSGAREHLRNY